MLKLKNITKSFPGVFEPVLKKINLSLDAGTFCVLIGANGSGKSTLMKVISGEYAADSGEIERRSSVAEVVQDVNKGTVSSLTLLENIALSQIARETPKPRFYGRYRAKIIEEIRAMGIGLERYIDRPLGVLSGGQRQIIATFMALNSGGGILLLDEHTSALDPKMGVKLMDYTTNSIDELGLTSMMITHKMDDAIRYGNRLIMLHQGKIAIDIKGHEKNKLKIQDLLEMFHEYEDRGLLSEGAI